MAELTETLAVLMTSRVTGRLLNLTGHEIVLDSYHPAADGKDGLGTPSVLRLTPAGQIARVDDTRARLGGGWVSTSSVSIPLTRLRRSRHLSELPMPRPGTWYVVSRLTAHAARHRGDLVFPFSEVRDREGRIIGARELGVYRRSLAVLERYRDWRARVTEQHLRSPIRDAMIGVLFATGTALLSAAAGLVPGALDNATGGQEWTKWLTVVFGVTGLAALGDAARRWLTRQRKFQERGTAYVIEEQAIHWRHEEKRSVLAVIADGFSSVLRVPGPAELGDDWKWQADAGGAPQWDVRTDQLVHSFWAVHYNDDHVTRNAVFVWAPWAVAMAFAARATARRRHGLVLHVRQRPSGGALGPRPELRLSDQAHDFLRSRTSPTLQAVAPDHTPVRICAEVTVTLTVLPAAGSSRERHGSHPDVPGGKDQPEMAARTRGEVLHNHRPGLLLLLVRFVMEEIGVIPVDVQQGEEITLEIAETLAASSLPPGSYRVPAAEWRMVAGDRKPVPWNAFPTVAESIADWIEERAAAHPGRMILLAARMPQEIAMGLGIQLGQRSTTWPHRLYPVHHVGGQRLVVPDLDLGRDSVRAERMVET